MNVTLRDIAKVLGVNYYGLIYRAKNGFLPWVNATKISERNYHYEIVPTKFREYYGDEIYHKVYGNA